MPMSSPSGDPILIADSVVKTYVSGDSRLDAVRGVSLEVGAGEFVALVGPSGCGKSTLLHLCGAMDRATAGRIAIAGDDLSRLSDDALTDLRRRRVGFVFQFFNLLPTLTVRENVALPLLLTGSPAAEAARQAEALCERLGVSHRLQEIPQRLSGGEAQRVAIARAVIHRPALVIADEPTGNLDSAAGAAVLDLLTGLNRERGVTLLLATHADDIAGAADRVVQMRDGTIAPDRARHRATV